MGYLYLMLVALFFSFGGTSVKLIRPYFNPYMITFLRFFVGVMWLLGLKAVRRQRFRADFWRQFRAHGGWLVFGAAAKLLSYITENIALSVGVSYGNILTQPAQMILMTVLGVVALHEGMSGGKWAGMALCILGILLISWNGQPLGALLGDHLTLPLLYIASGFFNGLLVFAQKKAAPHFDILDSNLFMFSLAAALGFVFPAARGTVLPVAPPDFPCIAAVIWFGFVTGIGYYLNAKAIPLVPFRMVALLQSTMVFFAIAWGILFFREPVSVWIIGGTVLFVAGIVMIQWLGTPGLKKDRITA